MKVFVNNTEQEIKDLSNLTQVLEVLGHSSLKGIAIAVNNVVVPKNNWTNHTVYESDKVTIIKATQGG